MWIIPCCAVKHKQLCCETFIFCSSEKSLSVGRKWKTKGSMGGREREGLREKERYRESRYRGGVIKEAESGVEMLHCYQLASRISLISPLHFFMNHNLFLTIVMCPEDKACSTHTHTHSHDSPCPTFSPHLKLVALIFYRIFL